MKYAILGIALAILLLGSCGVPSTVETEPYTVELDVQPNLPTGPMYTEDAITIPDDATQPNLTYERVRIHYKVETDSTFDVGVEIWVSDDTETNGTYSEKDDEKVVELTVSNGSTESGWADSQELKAALNAQQSAFVMGGRVTSATGTGTVTMTFYAEVTASIQAAQ